MFFGDSDSTIYFIITSLVVAFFSMLIFYFKTKKILNSFFLFSVISNIIFYISSNSLIFSMYDLRWIVKYSLWYWPWINLILLFWTVLNKSQIRKIKSLEFLNPTKRKILYSLIPFAPIILLPVFWIKFPDILISSIFIDIQSRIEFIVYCIVSLASFPFEPILSNLGMWGVNNNQFGIWGSGSEISVPGMIVVAIFYAVLIYILTSIYAYKKSTSK